MTTNAVYVCGIVFPSKDDIFVIRRSDKHEYFYKQYVTDSDPELEKDDIARIKKAFLPDEASKEKEVVAEPKNYSHTALIDLNDGESLVQQQIDNMDAFLTSSTPNESVYLMRKVGSDLTTALNKAFSDVVTSVNLTTSRGHRLHIFLGIVYSPSDFNHKVYSIPHLNDGIKKEANFDEDISIEQRLISYKIGDARGGQLIKLAEIDNQLPECDVTLIRRALQYINTRNEGDISKTPDRYMRFDELLNSYEESARAVINTTYKDGKLNIKYNSRIPLIRDLQVRATKSQQWLIMTSDSSKEALLAVLGKSGLITDIDVTDDDRNYILVSSDEAKAEGYPNVIRANNLKREDILLEVTNDALPETRMKVIDSQFNESDIKRPFTGKEMDADMKGNAPASSAGVKSKR